MMSLFKCEGCGNIENTACCRYNLHLFDGEDVRALCSECDPEIGKWHNLFPKQKATGYVIASDGFIYHPNEVKSEMFQWRMRHQQLKIIGVVDE